jgi:yecA family protein
MPAAARSKVLRAFLTDPARPAGTFSYHELQGFLFAIAAAPDLIQPSEWLPLDFNEKDAGYATLEEAETILCDIMTTYNDI